MTKPIFVLLLLATLFFSCAPKQASDNSNQIAIFNGISVQLNAQDLPEDITEQVKGEYETYFNKAPIQVPLFRYVQHPDYALFVGVPYNTSLPDLEKRTKGLLKDSLDDFTSDKMHYYHTWQQDSFHLAEYTFRTTSNSLVSLFGRSKQASILQKALSKEVLTERIKTE